MDEEETPQPQPQPEHATVNDRQRLATVVGYSIQLILLIYTFLLTNLEGPIKHYLTNHEDVKQLVFSFITGFHLLFVFSLFATIVQNLGMVPSLNVWFC
jgi:hypothetical protein